MVKRNNITIKFIVDYLQKRHEEYRKQPFKQTAHWLRTMSFSDFCKLYSEADTFTSNLDLALEKRPHSEPELESTSVKIKTKKTRMKSYTFQMPPELLDRLQSLSDHNMTSVSDEIRQAILQRLETRGY